MVDRLLWYAAIDAELRRAYEKHGTEPWGRHEFYGILLEEVDELWDAIKADEPLNRVAEEAVQVAAMVIRYLETGDPIPGALQTVSSWAEIVVDALREALDVERLDPEVVQNAWIILTAATAEPRWEPDRYNAPAFLVALMAKYRELLDRRAALKEQTHE